jgi:hypothetical protein
LITAIPLKTLEIVLRGGGTQAAFLRHDRCQRQVEDLDRRILFRSSATIVSGDKRPSIVAANAEGTLRTITIFPTQ